MIKLRRQQEVDAAFGKHPWRGDLARSRKGGYRVIVLDGSSWTGFLNGRDVPLLWELLAM